MQYVNSHILLSWAYNVSTTHQCLYIMQNTNFKVTCTLSQLQYHNGERVFKHDQCTTVGVENVKS
jgi:hypothetical protein